jgi:E3 ubiquitin-protein ligase UBR2
LEHLIEELCSNARVEAHKDLLAWTLAKYRQVAAPKREGGPTPTVSSTPLQEMSQGDDTAKDEKEWRAKMAAQKRAKIMAQMTAMQKNFMKENAKLFEATVSEAGKMGDLRGSSMDLSETVDTAPVALGPNQTTRPILEQRYTCILCQEDQTVSAYGPALVLAAFVQQSTVLYQRRKTETVDMEESTWDNLPDPLFLPASLVPAPHTLAHVVMLCILIAGRSILKIFWLRKTDALIVSINLQALMLRSTSIFVHYVNVCAIQYCL